MTNQRFPSVCQTSLALILAVSIGCGSRVPDTGVVAGEVTIDGTPVATGSISFQPVDGLSPTAGGAIVDGRFRAEVAIGTSKVSIRAPKVVGQRKLYDTPTSPVQPVMEESLPRKYNDATELRLDVTPGSMQHDFHLSVN